MPKPFSANTLYKLSLLVGLLMVITIPYFSWSYIGNMESQVVTLLERRVIADLDLTSVRSQLQSLQQITQQANDPASEKQEYTEEQLTSLYTEAKALNEQLSNLSLQLRVLNQAKSAVIHKVKVIYFLTALMMAASLVLLLAGFFGWYFHVQIFSDRRTEPRSTD